MIVRRLSAGVVLSATLLVGGGQCGTPKPTAPTVLPARPVPVTVPGSPRVLPPDPPRLVPAQSSVPSSTISTITGPVSPTSLAPAVRIGNPHPVPAVEQWHAIAVAAGWPESDWGRLSCIINRESGGVPTAHNPRDPGLGSFGLVQVNLSLGSQGTWALYGPRLGWNSAALLDPLTNLTIARDLFGRAQRMWGDGWRPWNGQGCRS